MTWAVERDIHCLLQLASNRGSIADASKFANSTIEFVKWADTQGVLLPAATAAHGISGIPLGDHVNDVFAYRQMRRGVLYEAAEELLSMARSNGIKVKLLKGLEVERSYTTCLPRQFGDLDPALPDVESLWYFTPLVEEQGYILQQISFRLADNGLVGGAVFVREDKERHVTLDVQFGGQPLTPRHHQPFDSDFWGTCESKISRVWNLRILLGESLERRHLKLRDLLDFQQLVSSISKEEIKELISAVRANHLTFQLRRFVAACSVHGMPITPALDLGSLLIERVPSKATQVTMHAFLASCHMGMFKGVLDACHSLRWSLLGECTGSYWQLGLRQLLADQTDSRRELDSGSYLSFVRVDSKPAGPLGWIQSQGHPILATPLGLWLPVPFGILTHKGIQIAKEVRGGLG
jgi:hypothetical protein